MQTDISPAQPAELDTATRLPVVHTVELLDWATGGPAPANFEHLRHGVF